MKISLVHATRGRPERTLQVREEWLAKTTDLDQIEHIYGVDSDDEATLKAVENVQAVVVEKPKGCFRAYNLAIEHATGDIIIPIEDDLHPQLGWDENVRAAMKDHIDFPAVLAVGDGQNLLVEWCPNRKFIEARGPLFHDDYWGLFGDTEWRMRCRQDKVPMVLAPGIIFYHVQFQPGSGHDPIFERKQGRYLEDEATYNLRGRAGWPA